MKIKYIKNRKWDLIPFDKSRIERAIERACEASWVKDFSFIESITEDIIESLKTYALTFDQEKVLEIEEIQDMVENKLMEYGYFHVSISYIIYRQEKKYERSLKQNEIKEKLEKNIFQITKSNWEKENFDIEKIKNTYKIVSFWLARVCKFEELEDSLKKYIVENIKTTDILKMMIKSAIDLISVENTQWQFIAWRLMTVDLYKEASKNRKVDIKDLYKPKTYLSLFKDYVDNGLYYKDIFKYYSEDDIIEAWKKIKKDTDFTYNYTTVLMYKIRYLLNPNKVIKELPQEMYMSAALFLAIPEKAENRLEVAFKIYEYCSKAMISLPTPTLLNARTNYHQLSSCFVLNSDDDLRWIYHNIENMSQISKFWGWIWVYLWNIRSKWGSIRWVKWVSGWVNPWVKVINDTAVAVNQLWARAWAISVTLDVWHRYIYDFIDLQT